MSRFVTLTPVNHQMSRSIFATTSVTSRRHAYPLGRSPDQTHWELLQNDFSSVISHERDPVFVLALMSPALSPVDPSRARQFTLLDFGSSLDFHTWSATTGEADGEESSWRGR